MLFRAVLNESQVVLNEMTVNGLTRMLSKDATKVDTVVLPKILSSIDGKQITFGLVDDQNNEVDATVAYNQIVNALKASRITIAKTGILIQVINKLASYNKRLNLPVRVAAPAAKSYSSAPIARRYSQPSNGQTAQSAASGM
jgi:hypothetical protein